MRRSAGRYNARGPGCGWPRTRRSVGVAELGNESEGDVMTTAFDDLNPHAQQMVAGVTMGRTKGGEGKSVEFTIRFRVHPESKAVFISDAADPKLHEPFPANPTAHASAATFIQALIDRALTE